jgi:hypothetical protein
MNASLRTFASSVLLLTAACSSSGNAVPVVDPPGGSDGGMKKPDGAVLLPTGELSWSAERIETTEGTVSHDGVIAFDSSGPTILFAEPDSKNALSFQSIVSVEAKSGVWQTPSPRTTSQIQNAYPAVLAFGGDVIATYNGYPGGATDDNDIYLVARQGGTWKPAVNLTTGFETSATRYHDIQANVTKVSDTSFALAWASGPTDTKGNPSGATAIKVAVFSKDGTVITPAVQVIDPVGAAGACGRPTLAKTAAGDLVVAAECGPISGGRIFIATNKGGSWSKVSIAATDRDDINPNIAAGPDGVHVAWTSVTKCQNDPAKSCGDIVRAPVVDGKPGSEQNLTNTPSLGEGKARVAIDAAGSIHIAYSAFNAAGWGDVIVTRIAKDGTASAPLNVTPGTENDDDVVSDLQIDAATGLPQVVYEHSFKGSDPLNLDIFRAISKQK